MRSAMPPNVDANPGRPALHPLRHLAVTLSLLRPWTDTTIARLLKEAAPVTRAGHPDASAPAVDEKASHTIVSAIADGLQIPLFERRDRLTRARALADEAVVRAEARGLELVTWFDPEFPPPLRHIPDPPVVLWLQGDMHWLARPSVAIVGSRVATPTGVGLARKLAAELADAGLCVVSGLARGIDSAAHRGALDAGGPTVAILGCGADVVYPAENQELVRDIKGLGVVASELPPGTPPLQHHFPLRNRIISGLSRAVVVVEAHERSGSLITARAALEQGRDVLAVPGNVASGRYRGGHALIKDGARLVETVEDVLDQIGWTRSTRRPGFDPTNSLKLNGLEETMASGESYSLDDLTARTGRPVPVVLAELGALELAGRVRRMTGGGFVRLD